MRGSARTVFIAWMFSVLVGPLAPAALAQTEAPKVETETTLGAPPEYRDVALRVDQLLKERKFDEARAICQQHYDAATDDETRALFLRGIGEVYKLQRSPQCIDVFKQVIEKFPNSKQVPWAKLGLAEAYIWKGMIMGGTEENFGLAMAILEQFLKDYPNHERCARALWGRGLVHERLGNDEAALIEYEKAVALHARQKMADLCLKRIIELQQKLRRFNESVASAQRYMALYPAGDCAGAQLAVAKSYALSGHYASAIEEFAKVLSRYPGYQDECAEALFQSAFCYRTLGLEDEARGAYLRLIETYPNHHLAGLAKARLQTAEDE
jgi:tetratricopeptide (TPR) repeat protein